MLNHFVDWLQYTWGATSNADGSSYSKLLLGSLNFWGLLEGTHLLTLMMFFGSILIVDLRLLGVAFKDYPVSTVEKRLLPFTITAMVVMLVTGAILFVAKPETYWHNLMFRVKMVWLAIAMINIATFHFMIEKTKHEWDASPKTPTKAKVSAIISLLSWVIIISCGRFIAYNWFECGKGQPDWVNTTQDCKNSRLGATMINGHHEGGQAQ